MKRLFTVLAIAASLAVIPARSWATPVSFDLGTGNSDLAGFSGPYAMVTIDRIDATHANVTFQSYGGYMMGDGSSVALNVNGSVSVLGGIPGILGINTGAGFTPGPYSLGGSGNADGFGDFSFRINSFDGFTHSATQLTFTLVNLSGTWIDSNDVLTVNNLGYLAASHIFVCATNPCEADLNTGVTGFAANGSEWNAAEVPEPASLTLLGAGLVAVASRVRYRRL